MNSDSEYKDDIAETSSKLQMRSEPEDIFEDIPETKDIKHEATTFLAGEPSMATSRAQVLDNASVGLVYELDVMLFLELYYLSTSAIFRN